MLWFLILLGKMDARLSVVEAIALSNPNASSRIGILESRQADLRAEISEIKHDIDRHIRKDDSRFNHPDR